MTEQEHSTNPICDGCEGEILGYIVTRGSYHLHPQTACFKKAFDKGLISSERF